MDRPVPASSPGSYFQHRGLSQTRSFVLASLRGTDGPVPTLKMLAQCISQVGSCFASNRHADRVERYMTDGTPSVPSNDGQSVCEGPAGTRRGDSSKGMAAKAVAVVRPTLLLRILAGALDMPPTQRGRQVQSRRDPERKIGRMVAAGAGQSVFTAQQPPGGDEEVIIGDPLEPQPLERQLLLWPQHLASGPSGRSCWRHYTERITHNV